MPVKSNYLGTKEDKKRSRYCEENDTKAMICKTCNIKI